MSTSKPDELNDEAAFFDQLITNRQAGGTIPLEADHRRATKYVPKPGEPGREIIDPALYRIVEGRISDDLIQRVVYQGGNVLDICCGPGWLSLELARNGVDVCGCDISPRAIETARRMASENPYRDNLGQLEYRCQDVNEIDLTKATYSTIIGYSAFHHVYDFDRFLEKCHRALQPRGLMVTFDDIGYGRADKLMKNLFLFVLPTFDMTYRQKIRRLVAFLFAGAPVSREIFSPMEIFASKHDVASDKIVEFWTRRLRPEKILYFGAFSVRVCNSLRGPDWFRYTAARVLTALDRLLISCGICRGYYRVMFARKRE